MVTPLAIENRLLELSKEVDEANNFLGTSEMNYHKAKTDYELAIAKVRLSMREGKLRVQDVQDTALLSCATEYQQLNINEAIVKSARANATRIRTQVDIARSIGTSVRASLEI